MRGVVRQKLGPILSASTKPLEISAIKLKSICEKAKGSLFREECILYAPSELVKQVEKQVRAEFGDQITHFEWFDEEEYTTIMVEIGKIALDQCVEHRTRHLINSIIGDQYIVALLVTPVESVGATDDLFNLIYEGAGNTFFIRYYAPERLGSSYPFGANPFSIPIHYLRMFEAVRTIQLDSASDFWERLVRPIDETYAKQWGINSFSKHTLASDWRDFLLEHLDFIKHIAQAKSKPLQIVEPALPSFALRPHASNGDEQKPSQADRTPLVRASASPTPVPA